MTNPNDPMPEYGTEEYDRWYRARFGPVALTQPPQKLGHKGRTIFLSCVAAAVVIGGIGAAAGNSGHHKAAAAASSAPAGDSIVQDPTDTPSSNPQIDQPPSDPPTSDDPSGDTAMGTPIGQTITITQTDVDGSKAITDVTVNSVSSHSHAGDSDEAMFDPKNGRFAVLNVTVKCQRGDCAYNGLYFGWQEADGTTYTVDDGNAIYNGYEPELGSGDLHAGQIKRGNVGFDVPLTKGAQIILSGVDDSEVGSWK